MDTNEKSENGFSIRDSFFAFLKSRRDDLHFLRTPPHSLGCTGGQKQANLREGFAVNLNKYKLKLKEKYGTI